MVVRQTRRLEVRLDEDRWQVLAADLRARGLTFADWIREKVDEVAEAEALKERLAAIDRLAALNIPLPDTFEELDELMNPLYDPYVDDQRCP